MNDYLLSDSESEESEESNESDESDIEQDGSLKPLKVLEIRNLSARLENQQGERIIHPRTLIIEMSLPYYI